MHLTPAFSASHLTKEVPNSWRVDISFNDDVIMIKSRKQEQCVKNHFRYEWEVRLTYDADTIKCTKVRTDHNMPLRSSAGAALADGRCLILCSLDLNPHRSSAPSWI